MGIPLRLSRCFQFSLVSTLLEQRLLEDILFLFFAALLSRVIRWNLKCPHFAHSRVGVGFNIARARPSLLFLLCAALLNRVKGGTPGPPFTFLNIATYILRNTLCLGFGQLLAAFNKPNVILDMLPDLSDRDIRELGLNIGWRLRFKRAVSTLTQDTKTTQYSNKTTSKTITFHTSPKSTKYYQKTTFNTQTQTPNKATHHRTKIKTTAKTISKVFIYFYFWRHSPLAMYRTALWTSLTSLTE